MKNNNIFKLLNNRLNWFIKNKSSEWKLWNKQFPFKIKRFKKHFWTNLDTIYYVDFLSIYIDNKEKFLPTIPISIRNYQKDSIVEIKIDNGYSSIKYSNNSKLDSEYKLLRNCIYGGPFNNLPEIIPFKTIKKMLFEIFGVVINENEMTILTDEERRNLEMKSKTQKEKMNIKDKYIRNVLRSARELADSVIAGQYNIPKEMIYAINGVTDSVCECEAHFSDYPKMSKKYLDFRNNQRKSREDKIRGMCCFDRY
jgi:hypothetical protein